MTAAGRPSQGGLSIGAVLERLRPEFPDVTISKIRFLESEGLLRPARSAAGYRQFASADVARLRFVLAAQRDHYLPLRVIKEQLDAADSRGDEPRSGSPPQRALSSVGTNVTPDEAPGVAPGLLAREALRSAAGIDDAQLDELERLGFVRCGSGGLYDEDALKVARTVRAMGEFGIEPRHLRVFRASVEREIALLEQAVAPLQRRRGSGSRARADETVRELASLSGELHASLLRLGLTRG